MRIRTSTLLLLALLATAAGAQTAAVPDMLNVDDWVREDLAALKTRAVFAEDPDTGYPGVPNSLVERKLERAMDASLDILLEVAEESRSRAKVLERLRGFLGAARPLDLPAAENERILWCYEEACRILRVEVEREQLEAWLYGPGGRP